MEYVEILLSIIAILLGILIIQVHGLALRVYHIGQFQKLFGFVFNSWVKLTVLKEWKLTEEFFDRSGELDKELGPLDKEIASRENNA